MSTVAGSVPQCGFGRVDHVAVAVHDADEAAARFVRTYGLVVVSDERLPSIGVRLVHVAGRRTGQGAVPTTLQLICPTGPGPVADHLALNGEGLHHVCFAAPDLAAVLKGLDGESTEAVFVGGRSRRCAFLNARPHGLLIELVDTPDPIDASG